MPSGERYKPEDVRMALAIHAMSSGVEKEVRKELELAGLGHIKYTTLRSWVSKSRKDEYEQICQEVEAVLTRESIDKWRSLFKNAGSVATEAMRQAYEALKRGEVDPKDLTKTAKDAAVVAAVSTDKIELLSGRPTDRVAHTGVDDLQRELASVGITVVIPGADNGKPTIDVQTRPEPALPAGAE
jgi:crotonobetainyl-CoA:carnitine CoA-transferase CaiB-like acyl-CoA transferase